MRPTDAQERAITTIDRDVCVDAGAGSGKTRVLIGRIMYLLQQKHATLDEIVAITFTEKAASEMKERLRRSCREQAPRDDSDRMTFWRDIERRVDTARISTIHGFCMNLLKQNAFSAGLDPEFAMLSEAESHLLRSETVQETVHRLLDEEDEAATRLAVELGTGRLSTELRGMLNQTASLERIVSSPDYADPEALARRWEEWVAPRRHALCVDLQAKLRAAEGCCTKTDDRREVLRQNLTRILDAVLSADDPTAACAAMAEVGGLTARGGSKKNWTSEDAWQEVKDVLDGLREAASWAAEGHALGAIGLKSAQLACDLVSTYRHVATAFEEAKQARNAFAFDDLILIALSILRDNDEVRSRVAQGIKHLLIDEFQDTDSRQLEIARLLTGDTEGPRLFIVGDAKQSIYRFRGAEVEVFGDARQDTQEQIVLKDNFRTLPDVLEFVNDLFARSGLLHRVEPEYRHLEPFRTPVDEARVEVLAVPGMDGANTDDYREHEAEMIARRIAAMCSGDAPVTVADPDTDKPRPAEFGDVAMLFRSTTAVYLYERALKDHGVPYVVVAGTGFYERQEVTDLRNLLRVVTDPMDELALLGLLRGPIVGLSDDALVRLRRRGNLPLALCEEPPEDEPERDHLVACRGLLDDLRAHTEMRLPDFLRYVLQRTNYEAVLLGQGFLGVQKALNVRKVLDVADAFSATRTPRLAAFVRHMDDMTSEAIREGEASAQTAGAGAVTLMTIHKSKGLEFPIVFLPDLTRKSGQSTRSTTKKSGSGSLAPQVTDDTGSTVTPEVAKYLELDERELEAAEHARILYVAMTRARDWLVLSGSPGAKGSKSSWFADLDALFCFTGAPDGEGRTGDSWRATVRREVPEAAVPRSTGESTPSPSSDVLHARANLVTPTHTTRRTFSVTELLPLMADGTVPDDPVASAPNSPINAAFRGTLTHRFFELWDFMQAGVPPVAEFLRRECPDARFHKMLEPSLEATANRFMETPLYAVLRDQKQLQREQPFTLRVDDALVTGVIDAVLDDGSLVDYKTGRPSPRKESQYHLQLHLYAASLKRIRNVEACAAHLCYLDEESPGSMVCNIGLTESSAEDAMNRASVAIRQLRDGG